MKNLLFFTSDYKIGISQLLTDQLISLQEAGVPVVAIAGENEQESGLSKKLVDRNVNLIRIDGLDAHQDFKRLVSEIADAILKFEIEIVHVQNNWQLALVTVAKMRLRGKCKFKTVYTLHGFRHNSPVKSVIARGVIGSALFIGADRVICMTEQLKHKFRALSYKVDLIPLGVNDDFFIEHYIEPATESLRLVFPAQFRHGKNQDKIIRAFAEYVKRSGDNAATLILPGNGELLESMKLLAKTLGVESQVVFPGFVTKQQVKEYYLASNIAIVASNSETFGQSIVEPYVLGRCVISTPVGIAPEIIEPGKNGYIFSSEADLTDILMDIHKNKNLISAIGHENFNNREKFSWKNVTKKYIEDLLS